MQDSNRGSKNEKNRREFLKNGMVAAGAVTLATGLLASGPPAFAEREEEKSGNFQKEMERFSGSWPQPRSSRRICGSNTTNLEESKTMRSQGEVAARSTPPRSRFSTETWTNTSTTTLMMNSATKIS